MGGICAGQENPKVNFQLSKADLLRQAEENIRELAALEMSEGRGEGIIGLEEAATVDASSSQVDYQTPWYAELITAISEAAQTSTGAHAGGILSGLPVDDGNARVFANQVMQRCWLPFSDFAEEEIVNQMNPRLEKMIGHGTHLERAEIDFGKRAPRFRDVRLVSASPQATGAEACNLIFRCDVDWQAEGSHFDIRLKNTCLGITGLCFRGIMFMELVEVMSRKPLFQGARVYFLDPPEISFDFDGKLSFLSELPGLKSTVSKVIRSKVSDICVAPQMIGFTLSKEFDIFRIKYPRPKGILNLIVYSAQDLPAQDRTFLGKPTCGHPYVEVVCGGQILKSEVLKNTTHPVWGGEKGFQAHLVIFRASQQTIQIQVHDEHFLMKDTIVGSIRLSAMGVITWSKDEASGAESKMVTLALEGPNGEKSVGTVTVGTVWRPIIEDLRGMAEKGEQTFWVSAGVYHAAHIPSDEGQTIYWVIISCDYLHPDWSAEPHETARKKMVLPKTTADAMEKKRVLEEKVAMCKKYGVSDEDICKLLGLELATLTDLRTAKAVNVGDERLVDWSQGADFLVSDGTRPTVTFTMHCKEHKAKEAEAKVLGTFSVKVSDLVPDPEDESHRHIMIKAVTLPGTTIELKLRVQLRFVGAASSHVGGVAGGDHMS